LGGATIWGPMGYDWKWEDDLRTIAGAKRELGVSLKALPRAAGTTA
jgi:hypothetical protein